MVFSPSRVPTAPLRMGVALAAIHLSAAARHDLTFQRRSDWSAHLRLLAKTTPERRPLSFPPKQKSSDSKGAGGQSADTPKNFHRQGAKRSVVERHECIVDLVPEAGCANIGKIFESPALRIKGEGGAILPTKGMLISQSSIENERLIGARRQGKVGPFKIGILARASRANGLAKASWQKPDR
jgi:hypothetical protein